METSSKHTTDSYHLLATNQTGLKLFRHRRRRAYEDVRSAELAATRNNRQVDSLPNTPKANECGPRCRLRTSPVDLGEDVAMDSPHHAEMVLWRMG